MYTRLQCSARSLQVVLGYAACRKAFQELSPSVSYTEKTVCIQDLVLNNLHSSSVDFYWWKSRHSDTGTSWRKQRDDWTPGVRGEGPEINCLSCGTDFHTLKFVWLDKRLANCSPRDVNSRPWQYGLNSLRDNMVLKNCTKFEFSVFEHSLRYCSYRNLYRKRSFG
jgi:hypothetical protein